MKLSKKLIVFIGMVLTLSFNANAQFGKLKVKKPKISNPLKKKKTKKQPKATAAPTAKSSSADSKVVEIENAAAARLEEVKAIFSDRVTTSSKSIDEIKSIFQKFQNKYSSLKNYYKKESQRLPEFQKAYDKYKPLVRAEGKLRERMSSVEFILRTRSEAAERAKADFSPEMFLNSTSNMVYYKEYKEAKEEYEASGYTDEKMTSYVTNLDDFFKTFVTGTAGHKFTEYIKGYRAFNENSWKEDPNAAISLLNRTMGEMKNLVYTRVQDTKWVDDLKKDMLAQKEKLQKYIDSGAYDKYKAAERSKRVEKVRMFKALKRDASITNVIKSRHNTNSYGTLKKMVILTDWYVEKNVFGIPIEKRTKIQVAVTKDGICDLYEGYVFKQYQGGGSYGSSKLSWYFNQQEIKCYNVNK